MTDLFAAYKQLQKLNDGDAIPTYELTPCTRPQPIGGEQRWLMILGENKVIRWQMIAWDMINKKWVRQGGLTG